MIKIGIIGSRRRNTNKDYIKVVKAFNRVADGYNMIISGGCPKGGDHFAEMIAKEQMVSITIYYANWCVGRHAGFLRNKTIAKNSDILIACVAKDRKGGTEDTIKKFKKFHPNGKIILV